MFITQPGAASINLNEIHRVPCLFCVLKEQVFPAWWNSEEHSLLQSKSRAQIFLHLCNLGLRKAQISHCLLALKDTQIPSKLQRLRYSLPFPGHSPQRGVSSLSKRMGEGVVPSVPKGCGLQVRRGSAWERKALLRGGDETGASMVRGNRHQRYNQLSHHRSMVWV